MTRIDPTFPRQAFEEFLERELAPSPTTRDAYRRVAARVHASHLGPAPWLDKTLTADTADGTVQQYLAATTWWWKFLGSEGVAPSLPKRRRAYQELRGEGVPPEHLSEFIDAVEATAEPYRTMFLFMLRTGLRVSECVDLTSLDVQGSVLTVLGKGRGGRRGGGGKVRQVPLSTDAQALVAPWVKVGGPDDEAGPIFLHKARGTLDTMIPYTEAMLQKAMRRLREGLGPWAVTITPHSMRHTFAEQFLETHGHENLVALQIILGHTDIKTTQRYSKEGIRGLSGLVDKMFKGGS